MDTVPFIRPVSWLEEMHEFWRVERSCQTKHTRRTAGMAAVEEDVLDILLVIDHSTTSVESVRDVIEPGLALEQSAFMPPLRCVPILGRETVKMNGHVVAF